MPKIDEDIFHPPVHTRKKAKPKLEKAKPRQENEPENDSRRSSLESTLAVSEGATPLPEDASRTEKADEVEDGQRLEDDEGDSSMTTLRKDSAAHPRHGSFGDDVDLDVAANTEALNLNSHDERASDKSINHIIDGKSGIQEKAYSVHPRANPHPRPNWDGTAGMRRKGKTGQSRPAPNHGDRPEEDGRTLLTNVLSPMLHGVVYLCRISCKPAWLAKQEKRMLIKEYLQAFNIAPCLGHLVFLNGHTFLTTDQPRLSRHALVGSFSRRTSKIDEKSKPTSYDSELQPRFWSSLCHGRPTDRPHAVPVPTVRERNDTTEPFEASARCTVETFNFSSLYNPKKHQGTRDLKRYISDFNNQYSPGLPNIAPDAPREEQIVIHGNRTFDFGQAGYSLGFGLEARNGALLSVRINEKGLIRMVTPCQRIFFASMKASSFMTAHWPDYALDPTKASANFDSVLRGLRVAVQQANGVQRHATVSEVSLTCPSDTVFEIVDRGVQSRITVEEYFSRRHGIALTDLTLPCLNIGSKKRPQYFPSSICYILPGQSFRKKVPIQATVNLHRFKQRLASASEEKCDSDAVDLIESTNIFQATSHREGGTLLDRSRIPYDTFKPSGPQPFELSDCKLPFLLVFAEIGNAPAMSAQVGLLVSILKGKLKSSGNSHVIPSSETCKLKLSEEKEVWWGTLEARIGTSGGSESQSNRPPPMVIVMIDGDNRNREAYKTVKSYLSVHRAFQCTCVNLKTLGKAHKKDPDCGIDKYASSLLRKILAKTNTQPIGPEESTARNDHLGAKHQRKTLLVGFHVAHLPPKSDLEPEYDGDRSSHPLLISVATKPLGLTRPYKISTVIQSIETIHELDLCKVLETHVRRVERDFRPNNQSRILVFRSGFCQLPVLDEGISTPRVSRDEIIGTEVDRFLSLSHSETFDGANIIYVTVEKPLKLKVFKSIDSQPNENQKLPNDLENCPKNLVIHEGISHLGDCELLFRKESRGNASHYPLRVRVRGVSKGDAGLKWKGGVDGTTVDEISRATYDYPLAVDSAILPAPIYFARQACRRALLLTLEHARTSPHKKNYSVIDVNRSLKDTLHYL